MKNEYILKPEDGKYIVKYGFEPRFRKWTFTVENFQLVVEVPSGASLAHKVATVISKTFRKSGKYDAARSNIDRMLKAAANRLKA